MSMPRMEEVAEGVVVATGTHVAWTLVLETRTGHAPSSP